jgi:hypothetical protein
VSNLPARLERRPGQSLKHIIDMIRIPSILPTPVRDAFAHRQDLTVAAEEELLLLDPATFDLAPAAPDLFLSLADSQRYRQEISPAQLEIVSGACSTSAAVRAQLADG